jgi:hypothetical protein
VLLLQLCNRILFVLLSPWNRFHRRAKDDTLNRRVDCVHSAQSIAVQHSKYRLTKLFSKQLFMASGVSCPLSLRFLLLCG